MSDLIDREVARTIICEKCENYSTISQRCKLTDCGGWCRVFSLYSVPTVDAKPVCHGRWIVKILDIGGGDKIRMLQCSECSKYANMKFDFCPNCGTDMREEGDENG